MPKDYYAILGVSKNSSADEIKKSFRRLAHEHHPDKGGDQQKFKDINEAYQVVGDTEKRKTYDQFGSAAFENGGMGGAGGFGQGFGGFGGMNINMEDLGDMFGDFFGGAASRRAGPPRGKDVAVDVNIEFLESVKGVERTVRLYVNDPCETCSGSGGEPGSTVVNCKTCHGVGAIKQSTRTMFGTIQTQAVCPECDGVGKRPEKSCRTCGGTGVHRGTREVTIQIPAGIEDGDALRVSGRGEFPGAGGRAGDLIVRIHVIAHSTFVRDGESVLSQAFVPYSTLVLGGEIEIETVDGKGSLSIPAHTETGTTFRIRGKGFPLRHGRGDQLVTVQAKVPRKLSREERQAMEELHRLGI